MMPPMVVTKFNPPGVDDAAEPSNPRVIPGVNHIQPATAGWQYYQASLRSNATHRAIKP